LGGGGGKGGGGGQVVFPHLQVNAWKKRGHVSRYVPTVIARAPEGKKEGKRKPRKINRPVSHDPKNAEEEEGRKNNSQSPQEKPKKGGGGGGKKKRKKVFLFLFTIYFSWGEGARKNHWPFDIQKRKKGGGGEKADFYYHFTLGEKEKKKKGNPHHSSSNFLEEKRFIRNSYRHSWGGGKEGMP